MEWTDMCQLLRELERAVGILIAAGDESVIRIAKLSGVPTNVLEELRIISKPSAVAAQMREPLVNPLENTGVAILGGQSFQVDCTTLLCAETTQRDGQAFCEPDLNQPITGKEVYL